MSEDTTTLFGVEVTKDEFRQMRALSLYGEWATLCAILKRVQMEYAQQALENPKGVDDNLVLHGEGRNMKRLIDLHELTKQPEDDKAAG